MITVTIETTYLLPIYRQRTVTAGSIEAACRAALADGQWRDAREDRDNAHATKITGIWAGADSAYRGTPIPVPDSLAQEADPDGDAYRTTALLAELMVHLGRYAPPADLQAHAAIRAAARMLAAAPKPDT
jgi:hypothetical protein